MITTSINYGNAVTGRNATSDSKWSFMTANVFVEVEVAVSMKVVASPRMNALVKLVRGVLMTLTIR
jgi:hypothetical protein